VNALEERTEISESQSFCEVDLAVMGRPPNRFPNRAEPFALQPQGLITAPDHPVARAEHLPAAPLAREPFIVREPGSGTRTALVAYLAHWQLPPMVVVATDRTEAIEQAVMAGAWA